MDWRDTGIVLSTRRHGEGGVIVSLLTANHGRHSGLVRGGTSPAARGVLQPGNIVAATWKARLSEHLGLLTCDLLESIAGAVLQDGGRLAALASACAVVETVTPERDPLGDLYDATLALLAVLVDDLAPWQTAYIRWEVAVLADLGYGLDLSCCAATGTTEALVYVSPRSGRAVSAEAGKPYHDRLLSLPPFLSEAAEDPALPGPQHLRAGLALTGWFLEHRLLAALNRPLPAARTRLLDHMG